MRTATVKIGYGPIEKGLRVTDSVRNKSGELRPWCGDLKKPGKTLHYIDPQRFDSMKELGNLSKVVDSEAVKTTSTPGVNSGEDDA